MNLFYMSLQITAWIKYFVAFFTLGTYPFVTDISMFFEHFFYVENFCTVFTFVYFTAPRFFTVCRKPRLSIVYPKMIFYGIRSPKFRITNSTFMFLFILVNMHVDWQCTPCSKWSATGGALVRLEFQMNTGVNFDFIRCSEFLRTVATFKGFDSVVQTLMRQ